MTKTASRPKKSSKAPARAGATGGTTKPKSAARARASGAVAPSKPAGIVRRDGTGHLDGAYAADLRARSRASYEYHGAEEAFLTPSRSLRAPLADELGREAVMTMTSAEDQSAELQDAVLERGEEIGGPFVPSTAGEEFAEGRDGSNPRGSTREPFPRT